MKKTYYQIMYRRPTDVIVKWYVTGLYGTVEQAQKQVNIMLKCPELWAEIKIVPIEVIK